MEIKRIIECRLKTFLSKAGAVLITGPKFCGKTYLGVKNSKSQFFIAPKTSNEEYIDYDYSIILNGEKPRLIDEWQNVWPIWDRVKLAIDESYRNQGQKGLYILTGSTKPYNREVSLHSGAGRIYTLRMDTLTFCEILNLPLEKTISLSKLAQDQKEFKHLTNPLNHDEVNRLLMNGGWPSVYAMDDDPQLLVQEYVDTVVHNDTNLYAHNLNPLNARKILRSLARLDGAQLNKQTIIKDTNKNLTSRGLDNYLQLFSSIDLIFNIESWTCENLRSSFAIRTKPKTYFCDTSIVSHLNSINSVDAFRMDLNTTGIIFENQVIKDLKVFANYWNANLYFYRDEKGNEIDAIIQHSDGSWWAIGIKLTEDSAIRAAIKLNELSSKIITKGNHQEPTLKIVITDSQQSLRLENGVYIIPHTLLRP